ncbi:hypothetical protein Goarm_022743, partial [Gossypium armourianum]|nr:hypothetical protein [Gossypium armourianum]
MHLFTDGVVARDNGNASTGGVLRDHKGIRMAIIQTDNLEVVRVLQDNAMADLGITMLRKVQRIMRAK